jgi:Transglutaminase-like superfamily
MAATPPETQSVSGRPLPVTRRSRGERLSQPERIWLAAEIVAAYAQARRALRRAPIDSAVAALRSEAQPIQGAGDPSTLREARRLGHAVTRTLSVMPGDTRCLARSLVLTRLLARRGVHAKLVIGARAVPDFLAHAWVEYDGQPVLDPGDESFGRLVEL